MYYKVLDTANWIFISLMILSVIVLIYKIFYHIYGLFPSKKFPEAKTKHRFAILVPARNESKVIDGLLKSFEECDYPKELFDVYVIVESQDDPTVEICKNYDFAQSFVRPNLDVKSKGGALDQAIRHIIENKIAEEKGYEAYFIFDADNRIAKDYLDQMNNVFDQGYDLALGYRNSLNWNDGWVASCSALTFSMINTFQNKCRARFTQNVLVSGTGFYISAKVINSLGGWPFQTLTEDAEISYYASLNNLKGTYNEYAEYFDEQPISLKVSWNQRLRWVKGFGQVQKKYNKKIVKSLLYSKEQRLGKLDFAANVVPVAIPLASIICYVLFTFVMGIVGIAIGVQTAWWKLAFVNCAFTILGSYIFFFAYAMALLLAERKHIDITIKNATKTCFMFPFYMALYIPIAIVALLKKEVVWTKIERKNERAQS